MDRVLLHVGRRRVLPPVASERCVLTRFVSANRYCGDLFLSAPAEHRQVCVLLRLPSGPVSLSHPRHWQPRVLWLLCRRGDSSRLRCPKARGGSARSFGPFLCAGCACLATRCPHPLLLCRLTQAEHQLPAPRVVRWGHASEVLAPQPAHGLAPSWTLPVDRFGRLPDLLRLREPLLRGADPDPARD